VDRGRREKVRAEMGGRCGGTREESDYRGVTKCVGRRLVGRRQTSKRVVLLDPIMAHRSCAWTVQETERRTGGARWLEPSL
jgi:hypothetical protein